MHVLNHTLNSYLHLLKSSTQQLVPASAFASCWCVQEPALRLDSMGSLTPVFPDYWSSAPGLTLQLHRDRGWVTVGETQKLSLILDLDEVHQLDEVCAVPFLCSSNKVCICHSAVASCLDLNLRNAGMSTCSLNTASFLAARRDNQFCSTVRANDLC